MTYFEKIRHHQKSAIFIAALLFAAGISVMLQMPISLFPDITFPRIVILCDNGEEPAERMLTEVTKPIEETISSLPGVRIIRSSTSRGSSQIDVFLDWGVNVLQTLELLRGQISSIRNNLPATASIDAEQMNTSIFPIEGYSLTSSTLSLVELRDLAMQKLRPALLQVTGVSKVEITGGDTREYQVTVSPEKLAHYRLDIRQVSDAITKSNFVASTGLVENNYQLYLSMVSGLLRNVDDIANVVITTQNGVPIRISDVAAVNPGIKEQFIRTTAHGHPAVLVNVMKQATASTVSIGQDVQAKLTSMKFSSDVHVENFYDQASYINDSISATRDSILIGIGLAMVVLLIFLRSWRVTLVIALIVPITIACTFICLNIIGETINIMTLGGIAAAVGLIIDDSIVIIESIFTHFEGAKGATFEFRRAVNAALSELMVAVIGSTASTIVIHIPLGFLSGLTGAFFRSLSITMVFAMLISFVLSITLAPLLGSMVLREKDVRREVEKEHKEGPLTRLYVRMMRFLFRIKWAVIPICAGILLVTYLIFNMVGSGFIPEMDEGAFVLDYESPPGTSLTETNRELANVESILMKIPEVESYSRRTGTQLGFFLTEPNKGDYTIKLKGERTRKIDDIISDVRDRVAASDPRLRIDFGQLLQDVIGDLTNSPSPVEIKLFGTDTKQLQKAANDVFTAIQPLPEVVDPFKGIVVSGPSMTINVDPVKAGYYGLTSSDIKEQIETMMQGRSETSVQGAAKLMSIRVQFPLSYRRSFDSISAITLTAPNNVLVPLMSVATIDRTAGLTELHREGLRQYIAVTARISTQDLGSAITKIKQTIAAKVHLPAGIGVEYGGVYQTQQESFKNLMVVALIALLLVFVVLLLEFREFSAPISIIIVTFLSLLGVVLALWITNVTLNISSIVGMIMMIGIVAENAIFIMHYVHRPGIDSIGLEEAILEANKLRIRPIAMTTLAAVLALLPLALAWGKGSQMQQPLAIAVIGGFCVSSLMLFVILPLLYSLFRGGKPKAQPQEIRITN